MRHLRGIVYDLRNSERSAASALATEARQGRNVSEDSGRPGEALTTRDFARHHGVSVSTVWRWIEEGRVEAFKCPGGYRWRIIVNKSSSQTLANPRKP